MIDLLIEAGPGAPYGFVIHDGWLVERFSRSSGPGGQSVNTADSRVELEVDIAACPAFTHEQRDRILMHLGSRLVGTRLIVAASEHRSQHRNRTAARVRMAQLIRDAVAPPAPPRRPRKTSKAAKQRRLDGKKRRSDLKDLRKRPHE